MGRCFFPVPHVRVNHANVCKGLELHLKYRVWAILCRSDVVYCHSTKMFMVLFNSVLYRAGSNRLHGAFSISVQLYITSNNISFNLEGASTHFIVFTAECFVILRARYMLFTSDNFKLPLISLFLLYIEILTEVVLLVQCWIWKQAKLKAKMLSNCFRAVKW